MLSWLKCDRNIGPYRAAGCDFDSRALCTVNPAGTLQTKSVQWAVAGGSVLFVGMRARRSSGIHLQHRAASRCDAAKKTFGSATKTKHFAAAPFRSLCNTGCTHVSYVKTFPLQKFCSLFSASMENVFLSKKTKKSVEEKIVFPWLKKKKSAPTLNTMFPTLYVHCINNTEHRKPLVLHRWCKAMQVGFFFTVKAAWCHFWKETHLKRKVASGTLHSANWFGNTGICYKIY